MAQNSHDDDVIPHGGAIVERFGGIRPMASKLNVPVTTVQGWKKRDAIPAIRREEILLAAATYDVDLKGLVGENANQNSRKGAIAEDPALTHNVRPMPQPTPQPQRQQYFSTPHTSPNTNTANTGGIDMRQVKSIARRTSFITSVALGAVVLGAGFLLFGGPSRAPQADNQRVTVLEGRVNTLESNVGQSQSGVISRSIATLEQKVDRLSAQVPDFVSRLSNLEAQLRAGGTPALSGVTAQVQEMAQTPQGQADWTAAMEDLRGIVTQMQGRMDGFDSALQLAKADNDALGRTLSEVSGRDLGAAAMLLTLAQVRQSIDRQTPFAEDLAMLSAMAGNADPELALSIERMAPYAEDGVLSPQALKRELQGSANDIITAKLKGEDVSIKDKIMGRLQGLFSIKKDGVDVAGGAERALIDQASAQLDAGDVQGAMATLEQLEGPAAEAAAPWQQQAAGTLAAQGLESQLVKSLVSKLRMTVSTIGASSVGGVTAGSAPINMAPAATPQPTPAPMMQQAPFPGVSQDAPAPTMEQQPQVVPPVPVQEGEATMDPNAQMMQSTPEAMPAPEFAPQSPAVIIQQ